MVLIAELSLREREGMLMAQFGFSGRFARTGQSGQREKGFVDHDARRKGCSYPGRVGPFDRYPKVELLHANELSPVRLAVVDDAKLVGVERKAAKGGYQVPNRVVRLRGEAWQRMGSWRCGPSEDSLNWNGKEGNKRQSQYLVSHVHQDKGLPSSGPSGCRTDDFLRL